MNAQDPAGTGHVDGQSYLDAPQEGTLVYADCISVSGWVYHEKRDMAQCRVRAWLEQIPIGETDLIFVRPDVCQALCLPKETATGFRFLALAPVHKSVGQAEIRVRAAWGSEPVEFEIGKCRVRLAPHSLGQLPHGDVVHPTQERVLHRTDIYGSGPPLETPSGEALQLIQQYLRPGSSVVDVGCGAGAYGPALIAADHQWLGVELNPACLHILTRRNLAHRALATRSDPLPLHEGEFENAICMEVLEHIENTDAFLRDISRGIRRRALFSVPNMEVIPYFSAWQAVPWHLLEGDHKNFFTRTSLYQMLRQYFRRVEVFSYGEHPLRTPDGIALHLHLFAVAEK